jgi:phytoene dehydrogenase-like protein
MVIQNGFTQDYLPKGGATRAAEAFAAAAVRNGVEEFAGRLVARAESYMPGLREHIVSLDIATPLTMYRYTLNDLGAPVGWSYTSTQRWQQRVSFIRSLYLAGH